MREESHAVAVDLQIDRK